MLTPKHRALFHAAYSAPLMRSSRDDSDLPAEGARSAEPPPAGDPDQPEDEKAQGSGEEVPDTRRLPKDG